MEVLTSEEVRRGRVPFGARVLEVVSDHSECAATFGVGGLECLTMPEIEQVRRRFSAHEPILVHCRQPGECAQAARELERMGYTNIFRYQGSIEELGPAVTPEPHHFVAPVINQDEVEGLLQTRGEGVHLLQLVADPSECPAAMVGVECVDPADLVPEGLQGLPRQDTVVLRCDPDIDCQTAAQTVRSAGFSDVRLFGGDYRDINWLQRM